MNTHFMYGVNMCVDFDLCTPLLAQKGPAHLDVCSGPDERHLVEGTAPLLRAPSDLLFEIEDGYLLDLQNALAYTLKPGSIRYHVYDQEQASWVEIWLLGTVLSFWLEWQQRPALHASAAVIDGQAVGFMATNKGGKSSLAATLMQQGHPLLTDDILALTPGAPTLAHPGFPQMRMWPEQAAHFVPDVDVLDTVHPYIEKKRVPVGPQGIRGAFCDESRPLAALYIPDRRDDVDAITIEPISQSRALLSIVEESFVATLIAAAGWQGRRLGSLSEVVKSVPVRRLIYPNGIEKLPAVAEAIRKDVADLK